MTKISTAIKGLFVGEDIVGKLVLAMAIGPIALLVVGAISFTNTRTLIDAESAFNHQIDIRSSIKTLGEGMLGAESAQRGYLLTGNLTYLAPFDAAATTANENADAFVRLTANDPGQQARALSLRSLVRAKLAELKETIALRRTRGAAAALAVVETNRGKTIMDQINAQSNAAIAEVDRVRSNANAADERSSAQSINAIELGTILAVAILAVLGFVLIRGTRKTISARDAGDAERARLLAKTAEDEARLRLTLNSTADGIITIDAQGTVLSVNSAAEQMFNYREDEMVGQNVKMLMTTEHREGHDGYLERYHRTGEAHIIGRERETEGKAKDGRVFPIALRVREMSSQAGKMYIGTIQDITARKAEEAERERLVKTIREVVGRLTSASSELLASSIQQSAAVQEQAASVAETVSTVDEVTQMAQQSADRTRDVADASKLASEVGLDGQQVVAQSIAGMKAVTESAGVAARSVTALAERAQAIGEIIATVNEIADQTNLLALNAAIEASRAGEHGRGFSVVATEVKALADQSKTATGEVRKILGEIQRAMGGAVSSTTEVGKGITSTLDVVNQAGSAIDKLANLLTDAATAAAYVSASNSQ
ncbi:MAG: methyl-accepting chemotaxis protein, partial [Candidatus Lustribacter sp.]